MIPGGTDGRRIGSEKRVCANGREGAGVISGQGSIYRSEFKGYGMAAMITRSFDSSGLNGSIATPPNALICL
jgi:hypothetical protein